MLKESVSCCLYCNMLSFTENAGGVHLPWGWSSVCAPWLCLPQSLQIGELPHACFNLQSGLMVSGICHFIDIQQASHASILGLYLQVVEASRRYDDICVPGNTVEDRESFLYQVVFAQAHVRTAHLLSMLVVS